MNPELKKIDYTDYTKVDSHTDNNGISAESYSFLEEILHFLISRKELSEITPDLMRRIPEFNEVQKLDYVPITEKKARRIKNKNVNKMQPKKYTSKPAEIKNIISILQLLKINMAGRIDKRIYDQIQKVIELLEYKSPMIIVEYILYRNQYYDQDTTTQSEHHAYPVCPRCHLPTEHDYQRYCQGCGQRLKWVYAKMRLCKKNS